jgi:hypothetical protein
MTRSSLRAEIHFQELRGRQRDVELALRSISPEMERIRATSLYVWRHRETADYLWRKTKKGEHLYELEVDANDRHVGDVAPIR